MNEASRKEHWDSIYTRKRDDEVSWFEPAAVRSLELVAKVGLGPDASVIDIGGGASRLVDGLLERGFTDVSVLDVSGEALSKSKAVSASVRSAFDGWCPT